MGKEKIFTIKQKEAVPLEWSGNILLQRPQQFTHDEYERYFNTRMIDFNRLNSYMSQPPMSIFGTVPVWVLKPEYQAEIRRCIMDKQQYSGGSQNFPKWNLDFTGRSENGDLWTFGELKRNNQERVLNWMFEPKNGICRGTTIGISDVPYRLHIEEPTMNENSTNLVD